MNNAQHRAAITGALNRFTDDNLAENARNLLNTLGYRSERALALEPNTAEAFIDAFDLQRQLNRDRALTAEWVSVDPLFQLRGEDLTRTDIDGWLFDPSQTQVDNTIIESYVFLALRLSGSNYNRTQLSQITREINKLFPMPAMLLFQHGNTLTLSVINRRLGIRDQSRDVLEKVTLIKDIDFRDTHRAHIDILFDLALEPLNQTHGVRNFVELHRAWEKTLDTSELNKRFFNELANWYFWAVGQVTFPDDAGEDVEVRNATSVIRLLTRLIFVWFIKEKGLVPNALFNRANLDDMLESLDPQESTYYKAILQNLFFATLNQEMNTAQQPNNRRFRGDGRQHYNITSLYRYKNYFIDPDNALRKFETIPFLNGGLFECLDGPSQEDATRILRVDGFSDRDDNPLSVPNLLFFSEEQTVDLSAAYGTNGRRHKVRGLIHILSSYKFTIAENTPIEEEVALDPELLGKVFENLLAAYNPETEVTARKQTGSYYTPREIVNYMTDESLVAYLKNELVVRSEAQSAFAMTIPPSQLDFTKQPDPVQTELGVEAVSLSDEQKSEIEKKLRELFAYNDKPHRFDEAETKVLIRSIDTLKILDPAVGSGAFPMGVLHRLVFILGKLDPRNDQWKQRQIARVESTIERAEEIDDSTIRESTIRDLEQEIENINEAFERNELDYGRKLYLIENCIYGVDIQPIATQIAKLRFFISLIVDQQIDDSRKNRGVRPLPNLETKFVAANTLIGVDKPSQIQIRNPQIDRKEKELEDVRRRHFTARTPRTKAKYRALDAEIRTEIGELLQGEGFPHETTKKIAYWDPYDQNASADWFDSEWMFGVREGFDVVIGNPPYIKEYTFRHAFDGLRESPYYQGKMDIWYMFACKGLDIVKNSEGLVTFIAQNNWVTSDGASKMRDKVIKDAQILSLIDFGSFKIFESGIQTMIMIFRKNIDSDSYPFDYRRLHGRDLNINDVMSLLSKSDSSKAEYLTPTINRGEYAGKSLTFSNPEVELILKKVSSKSDLRLDPNKEVAQGIVYPQDTINKKSKNVLGNNFKVGDGIFVLSEKEKNQIPFTDKELDLIKPSYTTKELHRYYGSPINQEWLIYTDSSFKDKKKVEKHPNIKSHLDRFRKVITSDNKPYGLHRARNAYFFEGEKIISVRKCARPTFTYVDFDSYVSATFYIIKTAKTNQKYLTGLLNSRLVTFWLKHRGKMQGTNYQIDKKPLLAIPLISPSFEQKASVESIVNQILAAKDTDPGADVSELENKIDQIVYCLYDLTPEEITIVEEAANV